MAIKYLKRKRQSAVLLAVLLAAQVLSGCASTANAANTSAVSESSESQEAVSSNIELTQSQVDTEFTDRDKEAGDTESEAAAITLNGETAELSGGKGSVSGSTVTITGEGVYVVTGTLKEGQIIIEAQDTDKIQLVFNQAEIHCETSAAIYVKQADKVFLTLAEGSENKLSGGTAYVDTDDNTVDGVVFSKDDLTINGSGSLEIDANYKHGIVTKDTLAVTGGTLKIDAVSQCLSAKDNIKILDGTFAFTTQGKAVKADNDEDTMLGNIYVAGGTFQIESNDDAFHAGGSILLEGGNFTVSTGDDAFHADLDMVIMDGTVLVKACYEGLEGHRVVMNGGEVQITSSDDAVNAAEPTTNTDSTATGQEDTKGTEQTLPSTTPPNGEMPSGEVPQGERPSGQRPDGKMGQMGGSMENDADAYIKITGGVLTVDAGGDGLDSNGSLYISGGEVYIYGPVTGADGALDFNGNGQITGGTVVALGSSGMAQGFGDTSTQCSILQNLSVPQSADSTISLTDASGTELLNITSKKEYSSVVISVPELAEGNTYTLTTGSESAELKLESVSTSNGSGNMMGGMPGGRGERKEQGQPSGLQQETKSENQSNMDDTTA